MTRAKREIPEGTTPPGFRPRWIFFALFFKKVLTWLYKGYIMTPSTGGKPETQNKRQTTNRKVKTMNTIDAIKDAATEIIAELKQWADWFGVDNDEVTEGKWEQEWQALTAAAKKAEMEHGLLTGDDLTALCALANDMMAALWGKPAATPWGRTSVDVTWFETDAEGDSTETSWERAEYGQLYCCLVSDSAADQRTEQGRKAYTRGERLMTSLADMVHVPAGNHDRDGVNEWLPLSWHH